MKHYLKMNQPTLISVIVPLYNKERWIERCIQSIIDQTYQNIEILIINDGSTDDSRDVVTSINDPRIKIYDKFNAGVSSARNLGIETAKGEYIAFIDADDEWKSRHLEVLVGGLDRFEEVILVCDDLVEVGNGEKKKDNQRNLPFYLTDTATNNHYFLIEDYLSTLRDNFFILSSSSVLIKLSTIREHQLSFYEQLHHGEDINFWIQLSQFGKFVFCDYLGLIYHRIDNNSAMNKKIQEAQLVPDFFYGINVNKYNNQEENSIIKFISREYYKKAYQNRRLSLRNEELSTEVGGGVQICRLSILMYLIIRYCPQFIFSLYKKIFTGLK